MTKVDAPRLGEGSCFRDGISAARDRKTKAALAWLAGIREHDMSVIRRLN
jgi:hypothetical protein